MRSENVRGQMNEADRRAGGLPVRPSITGNGDRHRARGRGDHPALPGDVPHRLRLDSARTAFVGIHPNKLAIERDIVGRRISIVIPRLLALDRQRRLARILQADLRQAKHLLQLVRIRGTKSLSRQPDVEIHGDPDTEPGGIPGRPPDLIPNRRVGHLHLGRADSGRQQIDARVPGDPCRCAARNPPEQNRSCATPIPR